MIWGQHGEKQVVFKLIKSKQVLHKVNMICGLVSGFPLLGKPPQSGPVYFPLTFPEPTQMQPILAYAPGTRHLQGSPQAVRSAQNVIPSRKALLLRFKQILRIFLMTLATNAIVWVFPLDH